MEYLTEPEFVHGSQVRTGILLINLGTPDEPSFWHVRRYLKEFLSDPRVVEIPRAIWWVILNGIILWTRPSSSARKYASIWGKSGSPLRVHTEKLASALSAQLEASDGSPMLIEYAMRYGNPSIGSVLTRMRADGAERILILPLYPQYASSTTGAAYDAVGNWLQRTRNVPEIRWLRHFHDHPAYIGSLVRQVNEFWELHGRANRLLISFHGLPRYTLEKGDPYYCECHKTARLLAEALKLTPEEWQLSFQSRFGAARWLEPYTVSTLTEWGRAGLRRVDVICPGFVSDCLETLEEIGMEGKQTFLDAGGGEFHLIPCLNERPDWVKALIDICQPYLLGWRTAAPHETGKTRTLALSQGAKN